MVDLKCPTPFVSMDSTSCVMQCPTHQQFVRTVGVNGPQCVYTPDPSKTAVPLVTVGAVAFEGSSLQDLQSANPTKYSEFTAEKDRFEQAISVAYGNIDNQQKLQDAFNALQKAENVRDQSPSAYQVARTAYYTLLKGNDWLAEERERISRSEVAPEVQKYRTAVEAINVRTQEQQKTIDIVNGLKDRVLSLKDDFQYSVNTFTDQMEKVKIQLNMENRSRKDEKDTTWGWVDLGLNVLLVVVLVYAVYTIVRRYFWARPPPVPVTTIRIPTYTGQPV